MAGQAFAAFPARTQRQMRYQLLRQKGGEPMRSWISRKRFTLIVVFVAIAALYLTDIGPRFGLHWQEIAEAKALAKSLKIMAPEAEELIDKERLVANELIILLEEAEDLMGAKFSSCLDRLVEIRTKRRQIAETLKQGGLKPGAGWKTPMIFLEFKGALDEIATELDRTEAWIDIAMSARFRYAVRSKLGTKGDLPELPKLKRQIGTFLTQPREDPLNEQAKDLLETYNIHPAELFLQE